jgi:GNAT superfamily N-acetyltransferase
MEFRRVESTPEACLRYQQLLLACFPGTDKFQAAYIEWLYRHNPDGQVVGFDAWDGDNLAAHYVCLPAQAHVGDRTVRVLLSLNTATHPNYQGKGLFTKLADQTYRAGAELGFDAVYGVANANSTPGFLRKLEFQLIEPLLARFGLGGLGVDFAKVTQTAQFRRVWSKESLAWRCANPSNRTLAKPMTRTTTISARAVNGSCTAFAEIGERFEVRTPGLLRSPVRLFLGLVPAGAGGLRGYFDIPKRLRPSPLNLIYRSLSGRVPKIDPGTVFLTFADFDAY